MTIAYILVFVLGFAAGVAACAIGRRLPSGLLSMGEEPDLVNVLEVDGGRELLTFRYQDGREEKYVGDGTFWYVPGGRRCSNAEVFWLIDAREAWATRHLA